MTRIHHVAFWVEDLDGLCAFYSEYFTATVGPAYENPRKGFASRFLVFESGAQIELMTNIQLAALEREVGAPRLGLAHLAFDLGSTQAVDDLTRRLEAAGIAIVDGPRRTGDGYYESVVLDPEGNRIELTG